jgi:hypothetical protein
MSFGPVYKSPISTEIPFDNSTNGFTASDVQAAIEEAKISGSGTVVIPEYISDPVSPAANDTWVLKQANGSPIGLLLALTTNAFSYKLSYKTISGAIVRTTLT